jgi:hypothetical protein
MKKIILAIFSLFVVLLYGCSDENKIGPVGSTHKHIDIKVYILGNAIDFSQQKYQLRHEAVHFENRDGDVLHTHATGINMGYMFQSLGMSLDNNCIKIETGNQYCSDGNAELKVFVQNRGSNWKQIFEPQSYVFQDNDRVLIAYGTEDEEGVNEQLDSVTNKAPIT